MKIYSVYVLSSVLFLGGCATKMERIDFNREIVASKVRTIGIVQAPEQKKYEALIVAHPGLNGGLIGGLIAIADMSAKSGKLTTALNPEKTALRQRMTKNLTASLEKSGYKTKVIILPADASDEHKTETVLDLAKKNDADAILWTAPIASYIAAGPTTNYIPAVGSLFEMVEKNTGNVIYRDSISYGYTGNIHNAVQLDTAYHFSDIDNLTAHSDEARKAFEEGIDKVSDKLVSEIKIRD